MDWSFYSADKKDEPPASQFWAGPRPDVAKMVVRRDVGGLVNCLGYDNRVVRREAVEALAGIGAREKMAEVEKMKNDPDEEVRTAASAAVEMLKRRPAQAPDGRSRPGRAPDSALSGNAPRDRKERSGQGGMASFFDDDGTDSPPEMDTPDPYLPGIFGGSSEPPSEGSHQRGPSPKNDQQRSNGPEMPEELGGFFDTPPDAPIKEMEKKAAPAPDPRKKKKDEDSDPSGLSALFG